jgi:hypothetical protein
VNNKRIENKIGWFLSILIIYPGLVFVALSDRKFDHFIIFSFAAIIAVYFFRRSYSIIKNVKGFLIRFYISMFLVSGSFIVVAISPEENNALAGAVLFLCLPSILISGYLLSKSKAALEVIELHKKGI